MGADKIAVAVCGVPLLRRALALLEPLADDVVVVTRDRSEAAAGLRYVADELPCRGPMAGLMTGLRAMRGPRGLVIPVDMPLLPPGLLRYLVDSSAGSTITVPRWRAGVEPLVGVYAAACAEALAEALENGRDSLVEFVTAAETQTRFLEEPELRQFGEPAEFFLNVNTPEDLRRAEALLAAAGGDGPR